MPVIEFDSVSFGYTDEIRALDGVTLSVEAGSFVCVLGGNGSGKSTLAKHVNALLKPDAGSVRVMGRDTADAANTYFIRSNAGMVFQNPDDQIVSNVIENDVAFGPENLGVPSEELRERVTRALAQVGLKGFEKKQTESLSGGQKQRVAIAGMLALEPAILVLDEASAMLDPRGRAGLLRVCRELNARGLTIVLITHFMEEAAEADRVIVLDRGAIALDGTPDEVFAQYARLADLALDVPFSVRLGHRLAERGVQVGMHPSEHMLEAELVELLGPQAAEPAAAAPEPAAEAVAEPAITFQDVSYTYEPISQKRHRKSSPAPSGKQADWGRDPSEYWALRGLTLAINRGEFFGIAGHTGSGKSTLIQLANGLLKPTEGRVLVNGRELGGKRDAAEARRSVGVVFQYPERQLFAATVYDDVAFGPRNLGYSAEKVEECVREALELVHLDLDEMRHRNPFGLSGGQQRRIAVAGVLAMQPDTLILDEPVAGLDPASKRRLLALLKELHGRGMTIVIVSHNMDDLAELCDRVLVLNEGTRFALGTPDEIFADEARLQSIGLGVPQAAHLANRLAAAGVCLGLGPVPTLDELADAVAARVVRQGTEG